ncbi:hypothetical protein L9F63_005298, partial [Diploptera punctata]
RWASRLRDERGHAGIRDNPHSGRPHTAQTPDNVQRVNDVVLADKRITVKELSLYIGIGEASLGSKDVDRGSQRNRKLGWTALKHPPYSPDLTPCDYHLFGKLKEYLHGTRFEDDDSLVKAVNLLLKRAGREFYYAGIQGLVSRSRKTVEKDGDYVDYLSHAPNGSQ